MDIQLIHDGGSAEIFRAFKFEFANHGVDTCRDPGRLIRDYDAFVEKTVGMIRASPNWTENSAIIVTFDEGESLVGAAAGPSYVDCCGADADGAALGGHNIATIVVTKCGGPATNSAPMTHYALLATIGRVPPAALAQGGGGPPTLTDLIVRPC